MAKPNNGFKNGVLTGILITSLICLGFSTVAGIIYLFLERPQLFPQDFSRTIDAEKGWQSSGVWVKPGNRVEITVVDGTWTHWKGTQPYNAGAGGGYICAKAMKQQDCVEPLPEFSTGGLIGRVENEIFAVGLGTTWKSTESGKLELRINDGDTGLYDNAGKLDVKIHLEP